MPLLLALFLVVHASIHIGYICGPAWPFVAIDPWLVTALGANPDAVRTVGDRLRARDLRRLPARRADGRRTALRTA